MGSHVRRRHGESGKRRFAKGRGGDGPRQHPVLSELTEAPSRTQPRVVTASVRELPQHGIGESEGKQHRTLRAAARQEPTLLIGFRERPIDRPRGYLEGATRHRYIIRQRLRGRAHSSPHPCNAHERRGPEQRKGTPTAETEVFTTTTTCSAERNRLAQEEDGNVQGYRKATKRNIRWSRKSDGSSLTHRERALEKPSPEVVFLTCQQAP